MYFFLYFSILTQYFPQPYIKGTGAAGFALWRSVYLSKQVSWRNRVLVALDWAKAKSFGRDITRI